MNDFRHKYYSDVVKKVLEEYTYLTYEDFLKRYNEQHRYFHTIEHLDSIFRFLSDEYGWMLNNEILILTTVFHDIVYYPHFTNNEYRSMKLLEANWKYSADSEILDEVKVCIMDTLNRKNPTYYCEVFNEADLATLYIDNNEKSLEYELKIRKEYDFLDFKVYRDNRIKILKKLRTSRSAPAIDFLISVLSNEADVYLELIDYLGPDDHDDLNILDY